MSTTTTTPGTDLLPFDPNKLVALESRAEEYRLAIATAPKFQRAFLMTEAMRTLREMITPDMLESIQAGEGQALGFKTDKWAKGEKYSSDVIRDVTIEATLRGYYMVDNEVNIIAGGFYAAKNGCKRRVREFPGLSGLQVAFSVPDKKGGEAYVAARAMYTLDGKLHKYERQLVNLEGGGTFDNRISIRVNQGQGDDAILGKAHRKFYAGLLEHLSGEPVDEGDADDTLDVESSPTKARRSTLFDDETAEPPTPAGPDPAGQVQLIAEYKMQLDECTAKIHVGAIAKQAGGDTRLTDTSRKAVADMCSARRKEL